MSKFEDSFQKALAAAAPTAKRSHKKKGTVVSLAIRTPSGVVVESDRPGARPGGTPLHDPRELRERMTLDWGPLGELKLRPMVHGRANARVWLDEKNIVTIQWPTGDGFWDTVARYRVKETP
jgi:hypothetical protein